MKGSSRKSAYVHVCNTSAATHAATPIRGGARAALRKRTAAALISSATYSASPSSPCSAATVTGIVCEAEVAFWAVVREWRLYSLSKEPDP